jgi:alkaline phosphatase D
MDAAGAPRPGFPRAELRGPRHRRERPPPAHSPGARACALVLGSLILAGTRLSGQAPPLLALAGSQELVLFGRPPGAQALEPLGSWTATALVDSRDPAQSPRIQDLRRDASGDRLVLVLDTGDLVLLAPATRSPWRIHRVPGLLRAAPIAGGRICALLRPAAGPERLRLLAAEDGSILADEEVPGAREILARPDEDRFRVLLASRVREGRAGQPGAERGGFAIEPAGILDLPLERLGTLRGVLRLPHRAGDLLQGTQGEILVHREEQAFRFPPPRGPELVLDQDPHSGRDLLVHPATGAVRLGNPEEELAGGPRPLVAGVFLRDLRPATTQLQRLRDALSGLRRGGAGGAAEEPVPGAWIGAVDASSARLRVELPGAQEIRVEPIGSEEPPTLVLRLDGSEASAQVAVAGLAPDRSFRVRASWAGPSGLHEVAAFRTPPRDAEIAWTRAVLLSCAREDEASIAGWRRVLAERPDLVLLLGDTPYIDSTDAAVQRRRHREFAGTPGLRELARSRPVLGIWDDHDFGRDGADGRLPGKEAALQAFREFRPNPPADREGLGVACAFRRGPVEFLLLDTRYFARAAPSPFDPDRPTLLGREQWAWLEDRLRLPTAPFKLLLSGIVWNGAVRPFKTDHWGAYPHELEALFALVRRLRTPGVVLVSGDIHRSRHLLHRNPGSYPLHELVTSPLHDDVMAAARVPHPGLVFDSGASPAFLVIDATPTKLRAAFHGGTDGVLHELVLDLADLTPP